jgi:hypothetical protein
LQKFVAILLIFSFLFGDAMHVNVLCIDGMVSHFRLHKRIDPQLGVLTFLKMHYLDKHGNLSQNKDHAKLPFKSSSSVKQFVLLCYLAPDSRVILPRLFNAGQGKIMILDHSLRHKGFQTTLFHPPSLC